jgi:hypothetical protein
VASCFIGLMMISLVVGDGYHKVVVVGVKLELKLSCFLAWW